MIVLGFTVCRRCRQGLRLRSRARRGVKLALVDCRNNATVPSKARRDVKLAFHEETRDDPTLKSKEATSLHQAGNPKRRGPTAASRRPEVAGTAAYLLWDCGSVGHRRRAMTRAKSPKREAWAACRNWNHGTYFLWDPTAAPTLQRTTEGSFVISVRRHLTKNPTLPASKVVGLTCARGPKDPNLRAPEDLSVRRGAAPGSLQHYL